MTGKGKYKKKLNKDKDLLSQLNKDKERMECIFTDAGHLLLERISQDDHDYDDNKLGGVE